MASRYPAAKLAEGRTIGYCSGITIAADSAPGSVITSLAGFADDRPQPPGDRTGIPAARKQRQFTAT